MLYANKTCNKCRVRLTIYRVKITFLNLSNSHANYGNW